MTYDKSSIEFQPKPTHWFKDFEGRHFDRLTVLGFAGRADRETWWWCECACGTVKKVRSGKLSSGTTRSCGCLKKEQMRERATTHGLSRDHRYGTWQQIRRRCAEDACDADRLIYWDRGITMCQRWQAVEAFVSDIPPRPSRKYSLDRVNNDGGYWCGSCDECIQHNRPMNVRWATAAEQSYNRRTNRLLTFSGKTQPMKLWAEELHIPYGTLNARINQHHWAVERALTTPIRPPKHL